MLLTNLYKHKLHKKAIEYLSKKKDLCIFPSRTEFCVFLYLIFIKIKKKQ